MVEQEEQVLEGVSSPLALDAWEWDSQRELVILCLFFFSRFFVFLFVFLPSFSRPFFIFPSVVFSFSSFFCLPFRRSFFVPDFGASLAFLFPLWLVGRKWGGKKRRVCLGAHV